MIDQEQFNKSFNEIFGGKDGTIKPARCSGDILEQGRDGQRTTAGAIPASLSGVGIGKTSAVKRSKKR